MSKSRISDETLATWRASIALRGKPLSEMSEAERGSHDLVLDLADAREELRCAKQENSLHLASLKMARGERDANLKLFEGAREELRKKDEEIEGLRAAVEERSVPCSECGKETGSLGRRITAEIGLRKATETRLEIVGEYMMTLGAQRDEALAARKEAEARVAALEKENERIKDVGWLMLDPALVAVKAQRDELRERVAALEARLAEADALLERVALIHGSKAPLWWYELYVIFPLIQSIRAASKEQNRGVDGLSDMPGNRRAVPSAERKTSDDSSVCAVSSGTPPSPKITGGADVCSGESEEQEESLERDLGMRLRMWEKTAELRGMVRPGCYYISSKSGEYIRAATSEETVLWQRAIALRSRIERDRELMREAAEVLRTALALIENGDFRNGVTEYGVDEGEVMTRPLVAGIESTVVRLRAAAEEGA